MSAPSASPSSAPPPRRPGNAPLDVLRNCKGKTISADLTSGETVNGIVMRTDRAMNLVVKQVVLTSSDGQQFWKARECLIRGASIRSIRMEESALRISAKPHRKSAKGGQPPKKSSATVPKRK